MRIKAADTMALIVDYQESLMKVMYQGEELEKKAGTLIRGMKTLGIPMVITQQYTKGLGKSVDTIYEAAETQEYMDKMTFSCYKDEKIADVIDRSGKKNIIICGIETHICVLQTCIDLKAAGLSAGAGDGLRQLPQQKRQRNRDPKSYPGGRAGDQLRVHPF